MGSQIGGSAKPGAPPQAPVSFVEALVEAPRPTRNNANGLVFEGKWCYVLRLRIGQSGGPAAIRNARRAYLKEVEFRRYKIGFKVKTAQTVAKFAFFGTTGWFNMVADTATTNELNLNFGADAGDKWLGFVPPLLRRRKAYWRDGLTVCYRYRLTVNPVTRVPQAVASATTYGDLAFSTHHLKSALLFSDRETDTRTATRALVP